MSVLSPANIAARIIVLDGWRAVLLAIVAGALSALSLAPYHFSPILLLTFPVLVWLLDGSVAPANSHGILSGPKRLWPAFKTGWSFGFGFFLAGFWWVGKAFLVDAEEFIFLLPVAVVALPAGLALFWGGACALARIAWGNGWVRIVALAAALTLGEWVKGTVLTGLPWNTLGYAIMPTPVFMQSANLIGLYGVTFITVLIAATPGIFAPGYAGNENSQVRAMPLIALSVVLMLAHGFYGLVSLSRASGTMVEGVKLRLVQPAIDQSEKWDAANEAEIMSRYLGLSNANKGPQAASIGAFTHVIWPESAFPFILTERRDQLASIAQLLPPNTSLITGAMRLEKSSAANGGNRVFNSLYVINGNGEIVVAADKTRLLPFGEYLPFQSLLESMGLQQLTRLRGGFSAGNRRSTISLPGMPAFLPLICYEIVYSGAVRAQDEIAGARPQWIINLTNDAWFGMTAGPYQHAHQAQVRAVEEGLPVIRVANNGISFVSDSNGRILERLPLGERGVVDSSLPQAGPVTVFSQFGNIPSLMFICLLYIALVGVTSFNTNRL